MTTQEAVSYEAPKLNRMIDANLIRLQEGLRVVEDIFRYYYNNKEIASALKELRHQAIEKDYLHYLEYRDIENDPLKQTTDSELTKISINALIKANIKRSQESARVLEEVFKLVDTNLSVKYKHIRYSLYAIEKNIFQKDR